METEIIIIVVVLGGTCALLLSLVAALFLQLSRLRRRVDQMQATGRIRVQKLRMNNDKNHAFHNPGLVPDEELSKRGFSMYAGDEARDPESARNPERQTGGLVDDITREIESRQQRQSVVTPPFLLQSIEENKRMRTRAHQAPNGRQSDTNPNFIY